MQVLKNDINFIATTVTEEWLKYIKRLHKKNWVILKKTIKTITTSKAYSSIPQSVIEEIEANGLRGVMYGELNYLLPREASYKDLDEFIGGVLKYAFSDIKYFLSNAIGPHTDYEVSSEHVGPFLINFKQKHNGKI